jgi:CubicO group peptidase (beta-lactamase class C family)
MVLHDGRLVAERYAQGIDAATPLPGWSMTKSVTATLVGILARDGRIDVTAPAGFPEWSDEDDPRRGITLDSLLRMTAGLAIYETQEWCQAHNYKVVTLGAFSSTGLARRRGGRSGRCRPRFF